MYSIFCFSLAAIRSPLERTLPSSVHLTPTHNPLLCPPVRLAWIPRVLTANTVRHIQGQVGHKGILFPIERDTCVSQICLCVHMGVGEVWK